MNQSQAKLLATKCDWDAIELGAGHWTHAFAKPVTVVRKDKAPRLSHFLTEGVR